MPQQFVVPQFIDSEAKIMGPVTARQFVILVVTCGVAGIIYALADLTLFLVLALPIFGIGLLIAFAKINGQNFHYFLLNIIQTFRKPRLRVWQKDLSDAFLSALLNVEIIPTPPRPVHKDFIASNRLSELSLVVNTGGMYRPDADDLN